MIKESCKVVAIEHLTLDGVYQAPARIDEDVRDGFKHGGWSKAGNDPKMQEVIGKQMSGGWSLLAGRTTYEDLYEAWPIRQPASPMTQALTSVKKFVACHDSNYKLSWENSTILAGEASETVAKLKKEHGKTLVIFGSGMLVRSLMQHGLVDEFVLMIHPLVLGEGRRLFDNETLFTNFNLTNAVNTNTGVIIATYLQK
ncbi:dihydrofolate reductase family protein [Mucilaginibacter sp. E4BP6]|uniref:dihydrofolate reductase family protein n=1 Tax=Mucilaginibacter sp. E4BP6 TaxID=2723089 RepID=UPI0015CBB25B|nr:dihydrofolate reductase family protein [Mucilaginibacter sp. E4BP6]NYE66748.1 dihydrofolate reductase [Mucilaginibacter sp. E4BP6]